MPKTTNYSSSRHIFMYFLQHDVQTKSHIFLFWYFFGKWEQPLDIRLRITQRKESNSEWDAAPRLRAPTMRKTLENSLSKTEKQKSAKTYKSYNTRWSASPLALRSANNLLSSWSDDLSAKNPDICAVCWTCRKSTNSKHPNRKRIQWVYITTVYSMYT